MITSRKRLGKPSLRSLIATRKGAFLTALVCALIAIGVLLFAMSQYRKTVAGNALQSTVLVSTAEIHAGTSADVLASHSLYKVVPVLASQVSPGAITNAGALVGKVAASTILPGEQLTANDFTTRTIQTGATAVLAPTERAVAVTLDPAHSVAGMVQVGDSVDIYGDTGGVVGLLVPDALVLKAPAGANAAADTFAVGVSDTLSPRIMWMFDNGKVWFELRGANADNAAPTNTTGKQVYLGNYLATTPTYSASSTGAKR
jgi:Flp pilus assembly protein CpaB